jgi:hypothetical protein
MDAMCELDKLRYALHVAGEFTDALSSIDFPELCPEDDGYEDGWTVAWEKPLSEIEAHLSDLLRMLEERLKKGG